MAIKLLADGSITIDSGDDVSAAAALWKATQGPVVATPRKVDAVDPPPARKDKAHAEGKPPTSPEARIRSAIECTRGLSSGKILSILASKGGTLNDSQIEQEYGSKVQLGGAFCHITKSCKKMGVAKEDVLTTRKTPSKGGSIYTYSLKPVAMHIINSITDLGVIVDRH